MAGVEDEVLPAWRRWVRRWRNRRNFQLFHRVMASTTVAARWFESTGISSGRIEVILTGVDVDRFRPVAVLLEKKRLREAFGLPAGRPVVFFTGSIVPRKGVDLLIRT